MLYGRINCSAYSEITFITEYPYLFSVCGVTITEDSGIITSPNYPAPYSPNKTCKYSIENKPGCSIELIFEDLDIEKQISRRKKCYDYLEIREGNATGGPLLGQR